MDYRMRGTSVHKYLPEFAQIHVHWVYDANHVICTTSPFAFNLAQHQVLFQWFIFSNDSSDGQNIGASPLAAVLLINIQGWFPLGLRVRKILPFWPGFWMFIIWEVSCAFPWVLALFILFGDTPSFLKKHRNGSSHLTHTIFCPLY